MTVEVCANGLPSAMAAQRAGADRIELCAELATGGVTPSAGTLARVLDRLDIPVHVLIRPRSGPFLYDAGDFEVLLADIAHCRASGAAGVVVGVLERDGSLNASAAARMREAAGPLWCTFHRAIDWALDPLRALETLEALGYDAVLGSGGCPDAASGLGRLLDWQSGAPGLEVIAAGGIRPGGAARFRESGLRAIHLSGTGFEPLWDRSVPVPLSDPAKLRDDATLLSQEAVLRAVVEEVKK